MREQKQIYFSDTFKFLEYVHMGGKMNSNQYEI